MFTLGRNIKQIEKSSRCVQREAIQANTGLSTHKSFAEHLEHKIITKKSRNLDSGASQVRVMKSL